MALVFRYSSASLFPLFDLEPIEQFPSEYQTLFSIQFRRGMKITFGHGVFITGYRDNTSLRTNLVVYIFSNVAFRL